MFRVALLLALLQGVAAFHDCVQAAADARGRRLPPGVSAADADDNCSGGLCVGMHDGPHEGGPASYPVGDATNGFTRVSSTMTVPEQPDEIDGITYYIWTDVRTNTAAARRARGSSPPSRVALVARTSRGAARVYRASHSD
jgi:hypothetical protein